MIRKNEIRSYLLQSIYRHQEAKGKAIWAKEDYVICKIKISWMLKGFMKNMTDGLIAPLHLKTIFFDRERFYSFVIMCVKYVKEVRFVTKQEAWKSINMDILKERLENDLAELRAHNYAAYEERLHEILVKFETLIEYEKVRYSHGLR